MMVSSFSFSDSEPVLAKINLFLHLTGRRADGYHTLESLAVFADVGERLEGRASPDNRLELSCVGPFANQLPVSRENILMRTAEELQRALALSPAEVKGASIQLHKHMPVASGIGGGSADAAAALRLLSRLWKVRSGVSDGTALFRLASRLGADVPACLLSRPLYMHGVGENVQPLMQFPALPLLLVNPGVAVPTAKVFAAYEPPYTHPQPFPKRIETIEALLHLLLRTKNDLEETAVSLFPVIGDVLRELKMLPECRLARMSGSGATCLGLFASVSAMRKAAEGIKSAYPQWWVAQAIAPGQE